MGAIEIEYQGQRVTDLPVRAVVHTVDTHNGWFASSATVPYTIPSNYTVLFYATFIRCCRSRDLAETNANSKMMLRMHVYYEALGSPVVSMSPPHYAALGLPFELVNQALAIEGPSISFSLTPMPISGLLVMNPCGNQNVNTNFNTCPNAMTVVNGNYTWTPTRLGMYVLQVRVTETAPYNAISVVEHIIYVVPDPSACVTCNKFPTLSPISFVSNVYIDRPFTLNLTTDDVDVVDDLKLVTSALPANMIATKISRTQHTISWKPSGNDYSTVVCFKVRDLANAYNTGASTCIAFVIYKWSTVLDPCLGLGHPNCGPGRRSARSTCERHFPFPIEGLPVGDSAACLAFVPKPAGFEACQLTPCSKYEYKISDWGFCVPSGACTGAGVSTRTVDCLITFVPGLDPVIASSTSHCFLYGGLPILTTSQVHFIDVFLHCYFLPFRNLAHTLIIASASLLLP